TRVRHVGVDGVSAVGVFHRSRSAADRFVIAERVVAERQVVHRSLTGGGGAERPEQDIHHALRGFDVAPDDRRTLPWVVVFRRIEQTFGQNDLDGREDAAVEGNVFVDEA